MVFFIFLFARVCSREQQLGNILREYFWQYFLTIYMLSIYKNTNCSVKTCWDSIVSKIFTSYQLFESCFKAYKSGI